LFAVETSGTQPYSQARFQPGDALIFGSERRGLPPRVLDLIAPERQLAIPMRAGNRSLNLSNAVALVVYEAWRQNGFQGSTSQTGS
jgi:tRNA (cytidine/uridine-2'-O-)-methyltransferase